jgi:hypothetical protein
MNSASPQLRARYIKTTASVSVRTLMLPDGSPPRVHEHEKSTPGRSCPSRCHRRTSIEMQDCFCVVVHEALGKVRALSVGFAHRALYGQNTSPSPSTVSPSLPWTTA